MSPEPFIPSPLRLLRHALIWALLLWPVSLVVLAALAQGIAWVMR